MKDHILPIIARLTILAFFMPFFSLSGLSAQTLFEAVEAEGITFSERAIHAPENYVVFRAGDAELQSTLSKTLQNKGQMELPLPSGEIIPVQIRPYRVAEDGFYDRFPLIQTFEFESTSGEITGFGAMSNHGLHAVGRSPEGQFYIDPTDITVENKSYAVYFTKDYALPTGIERILCESDDLMDNINEPGTLIPSNPSKNSGKRADREPLRQYRLAIATTGEYSQFHGGTKADVAAELVNLMIRVNEIMRREFSIEYILVDRTDTMFFLDPETDGFTNGNTSTLINQVNSIIAQYFDDGEYDLGHVLCTDAGGLASVNGVCSPSRKRRGVSCDDNPIGDRFFVELVCHEMGHQMGSRHYFNHCRGENENLPTGYEPGSGTSIMAYSGLCGSRNVST